MTAIRTEVKILNRVLARQQFSLGNYVTEASPWTRPGDEQLLQALADIARDREFYAQQLTNAINGCGGGVVSDEYPMSFTSLNHLALDYLLGRLVIDLQRSLLEIEECVNQLQEATPAWLLVSEVLGSERAHLEMLEQLAACNLPALVMSD